MATDRSRIRFLVPLALSMVAVACSSPDDEAEGLPCPPDTIRIDKTYDVVEPGAETREDAVRVELEKLGLESADQAISTAVIEGTPGEEPGTERVQVPLFDALPVTMTLTPLDPGWAVTGSSRCAPA